MNALADILRKHIEQSGAMTVANYMALALTHPEYGYYTTRATLGAEGDFLTAPEISQTFGEMLALWILNLNQPIPLTLTELGPGKGTLMADMVRTLLKYIPPEQLTVQLVEISPLLKQQQAEALKPFDLQVKWVDSVQQLPEQSGIFIANEWLDALPVHQLVHTEHGWRERLVTWGENGLAFTTSQQETIACGYLTPWQKPFPVGAMVEICPQALAALKTLQPFVTAGGLALFIDYGYQEMTSYGDSLQALSTHRYVDVLANPGEADITAHVNFPMLMQAAEQLGMKTHLMEQGAFLQAMGIELRIAQLAKAHPEKSEQLYRQLHRLTDASTMGQLFKVMCLTSADAVTPFPFG